MRLEHWDAAEPQMTAERDASMKAVLTFGGWLKRQRGGLGLTQKELAQQAGYAEVTLRKVEADELRPSREMAKRLAEVLQIAPEERAQFVRFARNESGWDEIDLSIQQLSIPLPSTYTDLSPQLDPSLQPRQEELANALPALGVPPYKGLEFFDLADADLFFGFEQLTAELVAYLHHHRFLAVVGASGSGKSSVVRAGLVPALQRGEPLIDGIQPPEGSIRWPFYIITPTAHPLKALAASLTRTSESVTATTTLIDDLAHDNRSLDLYVNRLLSQESPQAPIVNNCLLLVVDQFEELFTLCREREERQAFVDNLLTAASADGHTVVVITLRADFYANCAEFERLRKALERQQKYIGPIKPVELRRAIEEPARLGGWTFEPGLVDLILQDVGEEPGALPLLSHALLATWQRRQGRTLTLAGYTDAGRVQGAIAKTAETVLSEGLTPEQQRIARNIFLRLTELGEGIQDTRRRVTLNELIPTLEDKPVVEAVLETLVDARLVTTFHEEVEVAHEALIREWPTLRQWLAENREWLRLQRRLTIAAHEWAAHGCATDLLYRRIQLEQTLEKAGGYEYELNELERDFLQASQKAIDVASQRDLAQAQALAEEQSRRAEAERQRAEEQWSAARRLRVLVAGLALFLIVAIGLSVFALTERSRAEANLNLSEAQRLAAEAISLYQANGDAQRVALLAIQSLQKQYTPQGDAALVAAASLEYPRQSLIGHTNWVQDVAFSPDSRYVLTGSSDKTVQLWDALTGQTLQTFKGHEAPINAVAFSPDGTVAATAGDDRTVRLWDIRTDQAIRTFNGHDKAIWSVVFSPDGTQIATASLDKTARLWDVQTGQVLQTFEDHADEVYGVTFSPDGKHVASAGKDQVVRLWDVRTGQEIRKFEGHTEQVRSIAFSPDGKYLLSGSHDKTARLWDVETGQEIRRFVGHREFIWKVAFSPDGQYALTASQDKTARLWDVTTGMELRHYNGHANYVVAVAFSPDGTMLATAGRDSQAQLWNVQSNTILPVFTGHTNDIHWAVFSPDGRHMLTGSLDGTARIWDTNSGQLVQVLRGHANTIHTVAYAPDGRTVLTCSFDKTARIWDVLTGKEIRRFSNHTGAVYGIAVSNDGQYVATSGDNADPTVRLWNAQTGKAIFVFTGHTATVHSLVFSPDNKYVLSGSFDQTARLWDIATGRSVRTFDIPDSAVSLAFSPDGHFILTGSNDKTARLWDAQTGNEIRRFVGHTDIVKGAVFSPDGKYILTGSADNTARLWDAQTGQEVRRLSGHNAIVNTVAFSPNGRYILTGSGDRTARLWHVTYEVTVRALCGQLLRDLSAEERVQHAIADDGPTCL